MSYTIGEISKLTGLSISTIRYYDKQGLLMRINRTDGNIRVFDDDSIQWIELLECLKKTGMSLKNIKKMVDWYIKDDENYEKRYELLVEQEKQAKEELLQMQEALNRVTKKKEYYYSKMQEARGQ